MLDFLSYSRMQIGCLVFLTYVGFLLIRGKDEDTECNIFADLLLVFGGICVVFDAITAWSVNNPAIVSMRANMVLHGIFYILLETELWLMYFYFRSIANRLPDSKGQKVFFVVLLVNSTNLCSRS